VKRLQAEKQTLSRVIANADRTNDALLRRVAAVDPCPLTDANGNIPSGASFPGQEFHGNDALAVGFWKSNVVVWERQSDGSIDAKFGWWRVVSGRLQIEGRRLDGAARPLTARVPDGYFDSGFQPVGIVFPTEGCWEVTGRIGDESLTFVTLVLGR
jgi:hypothetical protein